MTCDFIVIGAGIIGMSTAWQLQKAFPGCSVVVLEKRTARRATRRVEIPV